MKQLLFFAPFVFSLFFGVDQLYCQVIPSDEDSLSQQRLDPFQAENDSLRLIMRNTVQRMDSLNRLNAQLEKSIEIEEKTAQKNVSALASARDYYFQLEDFETPKIYVISNLEDALSSQYWRIYSIPDSNLLITESFTADFELFEIYKERYDSTGAKFLEYTSISGSDSIFSSISSADIYAWEPTEKIEYSIKFLEPRYSKGFSKERVFAGLDSIEIMGEFLEVMRFSDTYHFYGMDETIFTILQQTYYAKEYGLVRYQRFNAYNRKNASFVLKEILSEKEWNELRN